MWFWLLLGKGLAALIRRKRRVLDFAVLWRKTGLWTTAPIVHRPRWHLDGLREASVPLRAPLCGDEEADWSGVLVTDVPSPDYRTGGKPPRASLPGYLRGSPISNSK